MRIAIKMKALRGWLAVSLLSAASFAATGDNLRLVVAAQNRDREAVRSLLQQHMDVNAAQADGATALAWASHWDDLEMADLLIRAGANVNAANDYGITPLSLACTNGSSAMAEQILKAGANPNAAQWTGETAFMTCARTGAVDAVKAMLARKADVNAKTRRGQTALMWAVAEKHPEVARVLIERGADVNATTQLLPGFKPIEHLDYGIYDHVVGEPDHHDLSRVHLDPASSRGGYTPLLFAARSGDIESAKMLIAAGAKVNVAGPDGSPLLVASASGHEALAILLLDKGADPNAVDAYGIAALHWAVQEGLAAITAAKIQAPTDRLWYHPDMPDLVKALLAHGANPNAQITKGTPPWDFPPYAHGGGIALPQIRQVGATPFFLAAAAGDLNLMHVLISAGADPKQANVEGTTPLMVASGVGLKQDRPKAQEKAVLEAVKLLVELGNDVKAVAVGGRTALHGAAYTGSNEIIQFLAARGADLNAKDKYGETPLSIAAGDPARLVDPFDKRFRQQPVPHKATADLLLKLGAAPLPTEAAKAGAAKVSAPSQYPSQSGQ